MSCTSATVFADKLKSVDGVTYRYSDSGDYIAYAKAWKKILADEYGISWNGEMGCLIGYCD